jgi:Leucine rich repeat
MEKCHCPVGAGRHVGRCIDSPSASARLALVPRRRHGIVGTHHDDNTVRSGPSALRAGRAVLGHEWSRVVDQWQLVARFRMRPGPALGRCRVPRQWDRASAAIGYVVVCGNHQEGLGWSSKTSHSPHGCCTEQHGLRGTLPDEIMHLSHLQHVIIQQEPGLVGTIPTTIGQMSRLIQWTVSHAALVGSLPDQLYDASSLAVINLESNTLTGTLSSHIRQLSNLQTLLLTNNTLRGTIPWSNMATSNSTNLVFLALGSNHFQGNITDSMREIKSLRYLYLEQNNLTGTLPTALGALTNLRALRLDGTNISGSIPGNTIGRLYKLEYLSMQNCQLNGSLPTELEFLSNLQMLNVASNHLTGTLPYYSRLTSVKSLNLADNYFNGTIDTRFADYRSLGTLCWSPVASFSKYGCTKLSTNQSPCLIHGRVFAFESQRLDGTHADRHWTARWYIGIAAPRPRAVQESLDGHDTRNVVRRLEVLGNLVGGRQSLGGIRSAVPEFDWDVLNHRVSKKDARVLQTAAFILFQHESIPTDGRMLVVHGSVFCIIARWLSLLH